VPETIPASRYVVARREDLKEGERILVDVNGRSIGVFNVDGEFYAVLNRCPHKGAQLCKGDVVEELTSERPGEFKLGASGRKFLACPWHGWEFDLKTGRSWFEPGRTRAKRFEACVEPGAEVADGVASGTTAVSPAGSGRYVNPTTHRAEGPYKVDMIPVTVEDDYIVLTLRGRPKEETR
jgi:3-phenylpropionate/trans-cinnamate dioxygenase ferredoxin subunit